MTIPTGPSGKEVGKISLPVSQLLGGDAFEGRGPESVGQETAWGGRLWR